MGKIKNRKLNRLKNYDYSKKRILFCNDLH